MYVCMCGWMDGWMDGWMSMVHILKMRLHDCQSPKTTELKNNKLRGFSPQSDLYRLSDRRLSAKLVPTLADRGCRVVSEMNPHGR
jgi:hypothetical protein